MATIQLVIQAVVDTDVAIDKILSETAVANGSISVTGNKFDKTDNGNELFKGQEMFTFGESGLTFSSDGTLLNADGHSAVLVDEKNGKEFVWGLVPESKEYTVRITVYLQAETSLTGVTFVGDSVAGQFPTEIVVNGTETYANTDNIDITVPVSTSGSREVVIELTKWNRANYNAVLTKIAIMAGDITLENMDIKTIESKSQSTAQPEDIYYGSLPSSGSAEIYDRNGDFYDNIMYGVLPSSNVPIELFVNGKKVQSHITTSSSYDLNAKVFSMDFENRLSLYEKINYKGYSFRDISQTLYEIFASFCTSVSIKSKERDEMLSEQIVYGSDNHLGKVEDYFKSIVVPYPYIESGTVRKTLDKFCQLTQLNLLLTDNDKLKFVQARPRLIGNENVLIIPPRCQMSVVDTELVVDNKISTANVVYKKVDNQDVDYDALLYTYDKGSGTPQSISTYVDKFQTNTYNNTTSKSYQYIRLENFGYLSGVFTIPRLLDNAIIEKIYTGLDDNKKSQIKFSISYTHNSYSCSGMYNISTNKLTSLEKKLRYSIEDSGSDFSFMTDTINYSYPFYGYEATNCQLEFPNQTQFFVSYDENTDEYTIRYYVLGTYVLYKMGATELEEYDNGKNIELNSYYSDTMYVEEYIPKSITVSIYGDKRTISFEDKNLVEEFEEDEHFITIDGNELFQDVTEVKIGNNATPIAEQISKNITDDYADGIQTMKLTVCCADYKDTYGVVRKHWDKGEMFQVGDIVRVDKDNNGTSAVKYKDGRAKLWKVTGRTFRNEGVPLIDLELQEVK